jgi:hypothetical protein
MFAPRRSNPPDDDVKLKEIEQAGRQVSRAALGNVVAAKRIERSGDVLGSLTHSMRNALTAKYLLQPEPPEDGNI